MKQGLTLEEIEEKYKTEDSYIGNDCASRFLSVFNQLHVWHWQTKSYSLHEALGDLYEFVADFADKFVEATMSNGPVVKDIVVDTPRNFESIADVSDYLTAQINYAIEKKKMLEERPDLQNMLDEYIMVLHQYKYKFTLK